jgi:hypothetical protein
MSSAPCICILSGNVVCLGVGGSKGARVGTALHSTLANVAYSRRAIETSIGNWVQILLRPALSKRSARVGGDTKCIVNA